MSIDSSMDKVLERRQEVESQLSRSAELSSQALADFSRELSELRPVCEQIELVRALERELKDAITMVAEAAGDDEMQAMAEAEPGRASLCSVANSYVWHKAQHFFEEKCPPP